MLDKHLGRNLLPGEQIAGLTFTDAEEEMALRSVNQNLASFETLPCFDPVSHVVYAAGRELFWEEVKPKSNPDGEAQGEAQKP